MRPTALNQTKARRYARRAQAAFFVVGAGALAIAFWGSRPRPVPAVEPLGRAVEPPVASDNTDDRQAPVVDAYAISVRFNNLANAPTSGTTEPAAIANTDPAEVLADQPIRFLGLLIEPNRRLALLRVGERQRLVAVGDNVPMGGEQSGTLRVVEIADTHVIIETDSGQKRIEKSLAQGPAVTYLTGVAPTARPTVNPAMSDPTARVRGLGRYNQPESPIIPPPGGARLMPADRRPPESTGERQ